MNVSRILSIATKPLVAGILAILPLALTVTIVLWLAGIAARLAGPQSAFGALLKQFGWSFGDSESGAYLGGVLFALLVIYVFGLIILTILKGRWEGLLDTVLMRLPVVSTVYDAAKRVTHVLEPNDSPDIQSMSPVMCSFGGEGGTSFPAFLTTSESVWFGDNEFSVVMIPTAPVPLGGAIMCVPKSWVTPLDCGIDGLLNVYLSMGTTAPDQLRTKPGLQE